MVCTKLLAEQQLRLINVGNVKALVVFYIFLVKLLPSVNFGIDEKSSPLHRSSELDEKITIGVNETQLVRHFCIKSVLINF